MMYRTATNKKKYKLNIKKFISTFLILSSMIFVIFIAGDLLKYPEKYITTLKYQLQNDIKQGNKGAIKYYNETYVENGINLFKGVKK